MFDLKFKDVNSHLRIKNGGIKWDFLWASLLKTNKLKNV